MDFLDSNIWLYAFLDSDDTRRQASIELVNAPTPVVSTQIINEVCVNLVRKAAFDESAITDLIESFYRRCLVVSIDEALLLDASRLRSNYSLSFWDGLVVASALRAGCTRLLTEDMHQGLVVDKTLMIENPFHRV